MAQGLAKYQYPRVGPDTVYILATDYASIDSGTFVWTASTSQLHNGYFETSVGNVGDSINYKCYLDAGVWSLVVMGMMGTARGIIQATLDGNVLGEVDTYYGSTLYNRPWIYPATEIKVPGVKIINLYATGKNASSTDERMGLTYIILKRV